MTSEVLLASLGAFTPKHVRGSSVQSPTFGCECVRPRLGRRLPRCCKATPGIPHHPQLEKHRRRASKGTVEPSCRTNVCEGRAT